MEGYTYVFLLICFTSIEFDALSSALSKDLNYVELDLVRIRGYLRKVILEARLFEILEGSTYWE
jgi:hypothetical protein